MLVEVTELIGRQVYTNDARLLGDVTNVVFDVENARVDGIFVSEPNQRLVEDSMSVNVPFRWVSAVDEVILLKYFPKKVSTKKATPPSPASSTSLQPSAPAKR